MKINWRGYEFKWIQGGLGVLTEDIAGHVHSKNSYEIHYIVGGKGELLTAEKSYNLREGMFFITGPNVYHEQKTHKEDPLTEVHCYLQCSGKKTNDILGNIFFEHRFYIGQQKKFKRYFLNIAKELEQKNIGYESMVECNLQYILTEYTRGCIKEYKLPKKEDMVDLNDARFLRIEVELMTKGDDVTLSLLAEKIGVCERQVQRLLEKYYGMNFTQIKKLLKFQKSYNTAARC